MGCCQLYLGQSKCRILRSSIFRERVNWYLSIFAWRYFRICYYLFWLGVARLGSFPNVLKIFWSSISLDWISWYLCLTFFILSFFFIFFLHLLSKTLKIDTWMRYVISRYIAKKVSHEKRSPSDIFNEKLKVLKLIGKVNITREGLFIAALNHQ